MGSGSFLASLAHSLSLSRIIRTAVHDLDYHDPPTTLTAGSPPTTTALAPLHKFQADLAERLEHLKGSPKTSAHLNWLMDALAVALSTQSSVHSTLIPSLLDRRIVDVEQQQGSGVLQILLQQRVDGMVGLLDVCNALKEATSDMEGYLRRLQQALQCLGEALRSSAAADPAMISCRMRAAGRRLSSCLDSMEAGNKKRWRSRLEEACASLLLVRRGLMRARLRNRANTDGAAATLLGQAMDGATLTTVLVLAAAVSSLGSSCKPTNKKSGVIGAGACKNVDGTAMSQYTPWATPLRQVQQELTHEEMGGAGALFQELDTLYAAAAALRRGLVSAVEMPAPAQLILMKSSVDNLCKTSRDLQASMATLHLQVGDLFQTLVAVRVALLDALA